LQPLVDTALEDDVAIFVEAAPQLWRDSRHTPSLSQKGASVNPLQDGLF
jgi:hypothetical protein